VQRRTSRALSVVLAAAAVAAPACGDSPKGQPPVACPETTPATDLSLLPKDIPLDEYATITHLATSGGYLGVISVSKQRINELVPALQRELVASRYEILDRDNEGFEAEIYFARGKTYGSYRMREGPCEGQVTVKLLYGRTPKNA
jgi:hypothetical protein